VNGGSDVINVRFGAPLRSQVRHFRRSRKC